MSIYLFILNFVITKKINKSLLLQTQINVTVKIRAQSLPAIRKFNFIDVI